jgi:hypothetical protein
MPKPDPKCPVCKVAMEEGYVLDRARNGLAAASWVEGAPEKSFWLGLKLKGHEQRAITSYRCQSCGLLLNFAP